jgi:protein phosphatase
LITAKRSHLLVSAVSHPGQSGKNNEDRYGVTAFEVDDEQHTPSLLAVIADGIGGHRAGEVAAELAVNSITQGVASGDPAQPVNTLNHAVIQASGVIYQSAQKDPVLHGMGSTCACAWVIGDRLFTASVGDSRIYLVRGERILQLTTDHTWVQEAIDKGALHPDQARAHPNAHVIRRYLGSRQEVVPDVRLRTFGDEHDFSEANQGMSLFSGDILLLSSDGLTDLVANHEILGLIRGNDLSSSLDNLVNLANQRGGHDNITIIALEVPPLTDHSPSNPPAPKVRRWAPVSCLMVGFLVVIGSLFLGSVYWFIQRGEVAGDAAPTQPVIQVTLFPPTAPSGTGGSSGGSTPTLFLSSPEPGIQTRTPAMITQPVGSATASDFTLTPWPTNTPGPLP